MLITRAKWEGKKKRVRAVDETHLLTTHIQLLLPNQNNQSDYNDNNKTACFILKKLACEI